MLARQGLRRWALAAVLAGAAALAGAAPKPPDHSLLAYAAPQTLARLPDGRAIHLFCQGRGAPTVIVTPGLGGWTANWRHVQRAVAATTRICVWDRPGYGYSSPSAAPQDVRRTTADLEAALSIARIDAPYVMVGGSLGAYETLLFTDRNPAAVHGIVLSDPAIPQQTARFAVAAPAFKAWSDAASGRGVARLRRCAEQMEALTISAAERARCHNWRRGDPAVLKAGQRPYRDDPARYRTQVSLAENFPLSANQVANPQRDYGAIPVIVLTAGVAGPPRAMPPEAAAEHPLMHAQWLGGHADYAALSRRGENRIVADAPHSIHMVRPDAVAAAILDAVATARPAKDRAGCAQVAC